MEPESARRRVATTSRPTPRPEISVTASRVEKPGSSVRRAISASLGVASASSSPRSMALARMSVEIEAAAVVGHLHGDHLATARHGQRDGAGARLAHRFAFRGQFESMVDGIAQDVQQRVDQLVQHFGVDEDVGSHDHERRLLASGRGGLAHVALQARHDGLHGRHARLRGEMLQFAHEALLLVQDARESGELVLESDAQVARVGGLFDQCARERLHFVVLVHFQRVEVRMRAPATACSLWRAATPRMSTECLELEQALLDGAVPLDQFTRMAGRGFQFLVELADLDRELAHHAHQVVEQLAWARAWWPWLRSRAAAGRCRRGPRGRGRGFERRAGEPCPTASLLRAASSSSMTPSALSGAESSPATVATICSRQSAADMSACARRRRGRGAFGFADLEDVFEAMRQPGDAADAEDVGRALERVRGAFGVAQQFGLRRGRRSSPAAIA